ncbi:hypothetical protein PQX77_011008 [Marasmius sp. AFHP31]|nr:hypothetical protein PQX77_011008 [Marasmius sp. AFHP31]
MSHSLSDTPSPPTPDEIALTDRVLQTAGSPDKDQLGPEAAVDILLLSKLTPQVLADIWHIADADAKGHLSRDEVTVALRLVGWSQRGIEATEELGTKNGPLATLEGLNLEVERGPADMKLAPIPEHSKRQYQKIFEAAGARNGLLQGEIAWSTWSNSGLSAPVLSAIWDLVDEYRDGYIRYPAFCLAMYLIQGLLERSLIHIPQSTSPEFQKLAQDTMPSLSPTQPAYGDSLSPVNTPSPNLAPTPESLPSPESHHRVEEVLPSSEPSQPSYELSPSPKSQEQQRRVSISLSTSPRPRRQSHIDKPLPSPEPSHQTIDTSSASSSHRRSSSRFIFGTAIETEELAGWHITPSFLEFCKRKFREIGRHGERLIHGDVVVPFLLRSELPERELSNIWDLADPQQTGYLSEEGLVVALFLVYRVLFGLDIPRVLPERFLSQVRISQDRSSPKTPVSEEDSAPPVPAKDVLSSFEATATPPRTPLLPPKPEEYKPDHSAIHDVSALQAECQRMKSMLALLDRENESLRSSLEAAQQAQAELDETRSQLTARSTENETLRAEMRTSQKTMTQLRKTVRVIEEVKQENVSLQLQMDGFSDKLHTSLAEVEIQKLLQEEYKAEAEALRRQTRELRDSLHIPSSGGDEELQMLINEDISRENGRLRRQVQELSDSVSQLQAASEERDTLKQSERAHTREIQRLKRRLRQLEEGSTETQTQLRRRVEELTQESRQLAEELRNTRSRGSRTDRQRREREDDAAPPAYEEIATGTI